MRQVNLCETRFLKFQLAETIAARSVNAEGFHVSKQLILELSLEMRRTDLIPAEFSVIEGNRNCSSTGYSVNEFRMFPYKGNG